MIDQSLRLEHGIFALTVSDLVQLCFLAGNED